MTLDELDDLVQAMKKLHSGNTDVRISVCGEVIGPIKNFEPDTVRGETVLLLHTDFDVVFPELREPLPPDWMVMEEKLNRADREQWN